PHQTTKRAFPRLAGDFFLASAKATWQLFGSQRRIAPHPSFDVVEDIHLSRNRECHFDRESMGLPLREAPLKAKRLQPVGTKQHHRLVSQNAIRPSAVSHNLPTLGQFSKAAF